MDIPGTTVNLACASSNRAITFGAEAILAGECDVVLAGGAESLTNVPIQFSRKAARVFMELAKAKTLPQQAGRDLASSAPRTWRRCRPRSPSTRPACRWASRPRRWRRRTTSRGAPRTRSPCSPTSGPPRPPRTAASPRQIAPTFPPPRYDKAVTQRQRHPRRQHPGGAREAQAGVRPPVRHADGRQLEPADRRRLGGAADERGAGQGARLRAARLHPLVRLRGARPRRPAPPGAGLRRAGGARRGRRDARRHRPGRDARGLRGADPLEPEGVRLDASSPARSSAPSEPVGVVDFDALQRTAAARSPSATRSAPPARGSPSSSCASCGGAAATSG